MNDLQKDLTDLQAKLKNKDALLASIGRNALLPFFGRRLTTCGVKDKTGNLRSAISEEGAPGNVFDVAGDSITVGVDYNRIKHARWVIEGADPHGFGPRRAKMLVFWWARKGRMFIGKWVNHPGQKPHPVYQGNKTLENEVGAAIIKELRP